MRLFRVYVGGRLKSQLGTALSFGIGVYIAHIKKNNKN
jgi:hypothetical protein